VNFARHVVAVEQRAEFRWRRKGELGQLLEEWVLTAIQGGITLIRAD